MNYTFSIITVAISLVLVATFSDSYADVISPKKQMSLGFDSEDVICKESLVKLFKTTTDNAACVYPSSAVKLVAIGWSSPLHDNAKLEITEKMAIPAGTVKHIATLNQVGSATRLDSTPRVNSYNYVFEACAGEKNIRSPEIVITSDSEVKSIKLASMLKSGQCRTTSVIVKASDTNSISTQLLNKGGITKTINDMESRLADLMSKLSQEKNLLKSKKDDPKQTSEITQRIIDLKKEINSQRYDLQKYNLFLFSDPKQPTQLPTLTSFTGKPVIDLSAHIISISKQVSQPKISEQITNYNVLFEACTGSDLVRIPFVTVSSDYESKETKIAEKISPNSCQTSTTIIFSKEPNTIRVSISSNQSISSKISEIESSIVTLESELDLANKNLEGLLSAHLSEPNLSKEITTVTNLISDLRSKIIHQKAEIAAIQLQVYQ